MATPETSGPRRRWALLVLIMSLLASPVWATEDQEDSDDPAPSSDDEGSPADEGEERDGEEREGEAPIPDPLSRPPSESLKPVVPRTPARTDAGIEGAEEDTEEDDLPGDESPGPSYSKDWVFHRDGRHRSDQTTMFTSNVHPFLYLGLTTIEGIVIAPRGFSPAINDAFFLEIDSGVGFAMGQGAPPFPGNMLMSLMLGLRYQLHLYHWFAPYVAGRGGILLFFQGGFNGRQILGRGSGHVGAVFRVSDSFALRVEIGYPDLKLGFSIPF
jgi:hypothetical protein